jgi:hypothetical protein
VPDVCLRLRCSACRRGTWDFGSREIGFSPRVVGLRPASVEIEETASVVRVGLNLRFGAHAIPVAAID